MICHDWMGAPPSPMSYFSSGKCVIKAGCEMGKTKVMIYASLLELGPREMPGAKKKKISSKGQTFRVTIPPCTKHSLWQCKEKGVFGLLMLKYLEYII